MTKRQEMLRGSTNTVITIVDMGSLQKGGET